MIAKIILTALVALIAYMVYKNNTTPSYLGVNDGQFSPMPTTPNAVSTQTNDAEKRVEPLIFSDRSHAKNSVAMVLDKMGNNEVVVDSGDYMHVIFTTPTMKFHDDLELYFDTESNTLQYRSQSRTGYSDKGLNRNRYSEFSQRFAEAESQE
ncbi:DUF1499 domain-containing protein [Vibrio sp. 10N.261.51.F12]|uniref:DUF1499 domain-containing protein n=1 Tax=Vibrio sp. 10N.261.51.F12 TaxID=3229679 RepID=UPI0035508473